MLILEFNRDHKAFDDILLASPPAVRAIEAGVEVKPMWANGAKVFVPGVDPGEIDVLYGKLLPRHVIIFDRDEQEILDALLSLPSRGRPRLKPDRVVLPVQFSKEAEEDVIESVGSVRSTAEEEEIT